MKIDDVFEKLETYIEENFGDWKARIAKLQKINQSVLSKAKADLAQVSAKFDKAHEIMQDEQRFLSCVRRALRDHTSDKVLPFEKPDGTN